MVPLKERYHFYLNFMELIMKQKLLISLEPNKITYTFEFNEGLINSGSFIDRHYVTKRTSIKRFRSIFLIN